MYDYTVWIVFYDLFALSENDEIKMINQSLKELARTAHIEVISIVWSDIAAGLTFVVQNHQTWSSALYILYIYIEREFLP